MYCSKKALLRVRLSLSPSTIVGMSAATGASLTLATTSVASLVLVSVVPSSSVYLAVTVIDLPTNVSLVRSKLVPVAPSTAISSAYH